MSDGFQLVKSKRRHNKKVSKTFPREIIITEFTTDISANKRRILDSLDLLVSSSFWQNLISLIAKEQTKFKEIVCYGLGNFLDQHVSRIQLATLLALRKHFPSQVIAYDPIFTPQEIVVLKSFDVEVILENDEGKRKLNPLDFSLVYFPHCSKQLVNNFIWANWGCVLNHCILLTNSFSSIITKNTSNTLQSLSCIRDIFPVTKETTIEDNYEIPNVFNDLSLHTFDTSTIKSNDYWTKPIIPDYSLEDIEFITKEIRIKLEII